MIQTGAGIVEMFSFSSLDTPRRVLGVLLLQGGEADREGQEADDEYLHVNS